MGEFREKIIIGTHKAQTMMKKESIESKNYDHLLARWRRGQMIRL
jgi:hypothetical protein